MVPLCPIAPPRALPQLISRWLLSKVQNLLVVCFCSKKRSLLHKLKGNVALSIARNLPVGLKFTSGTRILLRPDVLCAMPSHAVAHVFLTLQWNSLGRACMIRYNIYLKKILNFNRINTWTLTFPAGIIRRHSHHMDYFFISPEMSDELLHCLTSTPFTLHKVRKCF
jgi:hypothetical protein